MSSSSSSSYVQYTFEEQTYVVVSLSDVKMAVDELLSDESHILVSLDGVTHTPPIPNTDLARIHGFYISDKIDGAIVDAWTTSLRRAMRYNAPTIHVFGQDMTHVYARDTTTFLLDLDNDRVSWDLEREAAFHGLDYDETSETKVTSVSPVTCAIPIDDAEFIRCVKRSVDMFGCVE